MKKFFSLICNDNLNIVRYDSTSKETKSLMKILLITGFSLFTANLFSQTTYYISNSTGNDANAGTSKSAPLKTIPRFKPKNTYLLKRGDIFYNKIPRVYNPTAGNRITLSAYGTGAKPVLSLYVKILPSAWVLSGTNIWKVNFTNLANLSGATKSITSDIGFLKLNETDIKGAKKITKSELQRQWDFYSDKTYVYVYSTSKPSALASKIEASTDQNGINTTDNMTVSQIKIVGSGANGIATYKQKNLIIRSVDVAEIGGSYLGGFGSGTTRYGNGIQIFNGGTNNLIEGCIVKQVYDAGLTMQTANDYIVAFVDITFQNNLVDKCEQSFENTLLGQLNQPGYKNCKVINNNFRNAGYGWSHNVRPRVRGVHLLSYQWNTSNSNVLFEHNVFYKAKDGLYYAQDGSSKQAIPPYVSRNNDIWLNTNTLIRMNYPNQSTYTWKINNYQDFVNSTNKEKGSTWHIIETMTTAATTAISIDITSPAANSTFKDPASINVSAHVTSTNGIKKVNFYSGTTLFKTEYSAPYAFSWINVPAGNQTITAKAINSEGNVIGSNSITISVSYSASARPAKTDKGFNSTVSNVISADTINEALTKQPNTFKDFMEEVSLKLSPNPAGNTIFVSAKGLSQNKDCQITILSMTGAIVKTVNYNLPGKVMELNISSLNSGIYILRASSGSSKKSISFVKL